MLKPQVKVKPAGKVDLYEVLSRVNSDYEALRKAVVEWDRLCETPFEWWSKPAEEIQELIRNTETAREHMIALAKGSQQSNTGEPSEP